MPVFPATFTFVIFARLPVPTDTTADIIVVTWLATVRGITRLRGEISPFASESTGRSPRSAIVADTSAI